MRIKLIRAIRKPPWFKAWSGITAIALTIALFLTLLPYEASIDEGILSINLRQASANPDWLTGWTNRISHNLTGATGAGTNYTVQVKAYNSSFAPLASNGVTHPIAGVIMHPAAYYYNGVTYVVWMGDDLDPYIDAYTHSTGTWHGQVKVGDTPLNDDDHGCPAVIVDNSGYIHVFYGSHNSAQKYAKSTNTEDVSAWTAQSDIGTACTYPNVVKADDGTLYLFIREYDGTYRNLRYRKSTDWTTSYLIIEAKEGTNDGIYTGNAELDSTNDRVHIGWAYCDISITVFAENIYHAYLKISDGHMYSMNGTDLGTTITKAESDTYCKLVDTETGGYEAFTPALHLDSNQYPYMTYTREVATGLEVHFIRWNGSSWESPVKITDTGHLLNYSDFIINGDTDIDAYLTVSAATRSGDIEKWAWNGSAWSKTSTILAKTDVVYDGLNGPQVVVNGVAGLQCVFGDTDIGVFNHADLQVFAVDSSGEFVPNLGTNGILVGSKCTNFPTDICFTDNDGSTELYHWCEDLAANPAVFWIKVNDDLSSGTVPIYVYCGKSGGSSSYYSGTNTFVTWDDFERGNNGDEIGGSWTEVQGIVEISTEQKYGGTGTRSMKLEGAATNPVASIPRTAGTDYAIRVRVFKENWALVFVPFYHGDGSTRAAPVIGRVGDATGVYYYDTDYRDTGYDITVNTWHIFEIRNFDWDANTFDMALNDVLIKSGAAMQSSAALPNTAVPYTACVTVGQDAYLDNFIIRKFVATEPTHGAWGAWETLSAEITNTPDNYDFGTIAVSATGVTGLDYFTITNTGNCAVDITIQATNLTGGGDTWTLSGSATPGENIYGLKAGLTGDDYTTVVNTTANSFVTNLAEDATQDWGLKIWMPTALSGYDNNQMAATITLVASEHT